MVRDDESITEAVSYLFIAMSAADSMILKEEVNIAEKLASDFDISQTLWRKGLDQALITFINEGWDHLPRVIEGLSEQLTVEEKEELVNDLYAIALIDDVFHPQEVKMLRQVCEAWGVDFQDYSGST